MDRNQNSHFSRNPQANIQRSRFDRSHSVKFTGNVGDLIPFYCDEVLPGDTFQIDTSKLIRMQPLVAPIMDNIFFDTFYFFVPNRLVWDHWEEFCGENKNTAWTQPIQYSIPTVDLPVFADSPTAEELADNPDTPSYRIGFESLPGNGVGTIMDYMGVPIRQRVENGTYSISSLPFRAYGLIWNDWFRDQNLQDCIVIKTGDSGETAVKYAYFNRPLPAGKFHDYFTSCLPSPQKGPDVLLPLGIQAPVYGGNTANLVSYDDRPEWSLDSNGKPSSLMFRHANDNSSIIGDYAAKLHNASFTYAGSNSGDGVDIYPSNLWTDLTQATAATINQLRLAFQVQRIYEKDARGGTRYIEILKNHFGVTSPDSRLQRPEYLGGNRMMININQVIQQSETNKTPQGNVAAYSLTVDEHSDFTHSFVEHGYIIGVCCARYSHSYQQGMERFWFRKDRFDFYWPSLANIGEQPVYNREIFISSPVVDSQVFGYQEAWADYRYKPNRVCGEMRSMAQNSLAVWHLSDYYSERPTLSADWIEEDGKVIDRALAVTSDISAQFFGDIYIKNYCTRPMPLFSIPGLMDHH